jgi:OmcA/MtrC family decaheme c-type cytochrome
VKFKITDKNGAAIAPASMSSFALTLAGPTTDYTWYVRETATAAQYDGGIGTYTFKTTVPQGATGTYVIEADGYVNTLLNPGTEKEEAYRDAFNNVVHPFAVTGQVVARREVVDLEKCNACHGKLQLHGNNRNQIEACVVCHNPATTDAAVRPAANLPAESIDMQVMIHKIHTGVGLANEYTVYGRGSTPHNYNEIGYPGDRRNCLACHKDEASFTVPLPSTNIATTTPRGYWDPTKPTAAACLGCHDSVESAAHAYLNTATFGEACAVCHAEGSDYGVLKVHAR